MKIANKSQLFKDVQFIRYMGSKRNILDHVVKSIIKVHKKKTYFCDLMAGTNSVGYAMKTLDPSTGIIANDSQRYSFVISNALIKNNVIEKVSLSEVKKDLLKNYKKNYKKISSRWTNRHIVKNQFRSNSGNAQKFLNIFENVPYSLFTFYFAGIFFSAEQCKEIDSLRYAIDLMTSTRKRDFYLACLLYAVSYGSSSFGHFAQPRNTTSEVVRLRKRSIKNLFFRRVKDLKIQKNEKRNYCFSMNYDRLFKNKRFLELSKKIGTIYLDPPYTEANYSRFYHVLETLVKYDYPENRHKGLYRGKRFISSFTRKNEVEDSFRRVISFAHKIKSNLVISYSNTGLITKKNLLSLCRAVYKGKSLVYAEQDIHHKHSTQGNRKKNGVNEILIVCKY